MIRSLFIFLLYTLCFQIGHTQEVKFAMPLKGIQGQDYFISNYVDHDPTGGIKDAFCTKKTYNGHAGTDFSIRSFKTMDSGIYVYAAADGVVFETIDGEYDRNKEWKGGGLGNHVGILHKNGLSSYYGHMMKYSLLVSIGDSIKAGQPIGKVGSSGKSKGPHLHFEVRDNERNIIDPFSADCQITSPSLWLSQPENDIRSYVINQGFTPYYPRWDSIKEQILVRDTFYIGIDTAICFWVFAHGKQMGSTIKIDWYDPYGLLHHSHHYTCDDNWVGYLWAGIRMPSKKGKWKIKFYIDNSLFTTADFYVMKSMLH